MSPKIYTIAYAVSLHAVFSIKLGVTVCCILLPSLYPYRPLCRSLRGGIDGGSTLPHLKQPPPGVVQARCIILNKGGVAQPPSLGLSQGPIPRA